MQQQHKTENKSRTTPVWLLQLIGLIILTLTIYFEATVDGFKTPREVYLILAGVIFPIELFKIGMKYFMKGNIKE